MADPVLHSEGRLITDEGTRITLTSLGVSPSAAYTTSNVTVDRSFDADTVLVAELADVVGTLISDLQSRGLLG